ncbi:MAG: GTPase HflX, partial [Candidatus Bipolaricaulota bacterium]
RRDQIRDLPHQLVPAFQGTLGVVRDAVALLLVLDATAPAVSEHLRVVRQVIAEVLGPDTPHPPVLHVLNKLDLIKTQAEEAQLAAVRFEAVPHVAISAKTGDNLPALRESLQALLAGRSLEPVVSHPES